MARILLIEDENAYRELIKNILVHEDYEVFTAGDGSAALKILETQSVDLVITDIIMPNKDGIEIIEDLKKNHPQIKIIAISGGGGIKKADCLKLAESIGADRTLEKPIDRKDLLSEVQALLSLQNKIT